MRIIAGIDIGSSKIATIIAKVTPEEEKINIIGAATVPSAGIKKGQIVNIEEATNGIIASVEAAERMAGYNVSKVLVSIGGAHIASQNSRGVVAVAEPEREITSEDVRRVFEAARAVSLPSSREIIHCLPRFFTVDSQEGVKDPIGMTGVRLEVETHIVTGATTALRNLTKCISEVGADTESIVFGGFAGSMSVLTETEKELGVVLVDIGGGTTDIVIFIEGAPAYSSVLPLGAKNVTNDLAIGLRLSIENAEKLKLSLSAGEKKAARPEGEEEKESSDEIELLSLGIQDEDRKVSRKTLVEGIIKPRLNEIFNYVGLEIKKSGFGGMTPSGLVLTGGGAQTIGAIEAAKRTLSMPIRVGIPGGVTGLVDDVLQPSFASSLGLIIYGSKMDEESSAKVSFSSLGRIVKSVPIGGVTQKITELIKSFLP
ncbi:MAG: cell division protein FtsA [bacterium]|nr:cell division protein FtsA [bacterium]